MPVKNYQDKIRDLSSILGIKPTSQYITHIELAAIFFYANPLKFLKQNGQIFFVMPKSVLNGDHCYKFRAFSIFFSSLTRKLFFSDESIVRKSENKLVELFGESSFSPLHSFLHRFI